MQKKRKGNQSSKEPAENRRPKYIFNPDGGQTKEKTRLDITETDEDEDEGVGDGQMGDASQLHRRLRDL